MFERYERQVDIVAICPTLSVSLVLSENLSTFKVGRLGLGRTKDRPDCCVAPGTAEGTTG